MSKEAANVLDMEKVYTYKDTNFALAFGIVDKNFNPVKMPSTVDLLSHFSIQTGTESRSDDLSKSSVKQNSGIHLCTQDDKKYFYEFVDMDTQGIDRIWENLFCLDDPTTIKF